MTTHDPPLLPPHIPPGRGRVMWGVPEVFCLHLLLLLLKTILLSPAAGLRAHNL